MRTWLNRFRKIQMKYVCRTGMLICFFALIVQWGTPVYANDYKTVKVGYYQREGFQEGDNQDTLRSGYGYEYLQKIASYTGWKYEYISGDWDTLYQKLLDGEIDLLAGVSYDKERSTEILYPDYEMLKETFYIYKDCNDSSMQSGVVSSYAGKKIGVVDEEKMTACLENWKDTANADISITKFKDLATCADAFNTHQIDGFVSADNIVSGYTGITPVEMIGKVPYYICVADGENETLDELNTALSLINGQDSIFLSNLKTKYSADTSISIFLTKQEKEWMDAHPKITVGYLDRYLPYCDTADDGSVQGMLKDTLTDLFECLPGGYEPEITYISYESHEDLFEALKDKAVDMIFPVGGGAPYAEQCGYQQSSVAVSAAVDLVYTGDYDSSKTRKIAVNKNNRLQCEFTDSQYPDAEILLCDSGEECIREVKKGKADCTFVEALRAIKLVGQDEDLQIVPLPTTFDICFGVDYGNSALLRVLNHGLSMLGEEYGLSHAYQYMGDIVSYDMNDFIKRNIWILYVLFALLVFWVSCIFWIRYRSMKKISETETRHSRILQEALMKAHQASYTRQIFINNMSHDIRTPLNAIQGFIEINQKCTDPEKVEENRQKAAACVNQLLGMLNDVLEMSKLENGQILDMNENVNLCQVLNSLDRSMRQQVGEAGMEFIHESTENMDKCPPVYGNTTCIQEILQHVLGNAVKYNHEGGQIHWKDELNWLEDGKVEYKCRISDTGVGMKAEFLKHIFEPFAQERYDARTTYKGAGLGMAIVKMLLDQMHGTIKISSEENKGTIVEIHLPLTVYTEKAEKQIPDEEAKPLETDSPDLSGIRILLVEDNELNIEIAQFMLEDAGAEVTVARDGEQAVKAYLETENQKFDAVLMDIMMPVMDGYEATRKIRMAGREDSAKIPIIATTACTTEEARKEGELAGFSAFLTKPLDMNKVMQTIWKMIVGKEEHVGSITQNWHKL